jgi:hypothetical protein
VTEVYAPPMRDISRDASFAPGRRRCLVCDVEILSPRGRHYCSSACRNKAWRRRRYETTFRSDRDLPGQPSWQAIYECPRCRRRLIDDHRCPDCNLFGNRLGLGGPCPHCHEPVLLTDLAGGRADL